MPFLRFDGMPECFFIAVKNGTLWLINHAHLEEHITVLHHGSGIHQSITDSDACNATGHNTVANICKELAYE